MSLCDLAVFNVSVSNLQLVLLIGRLKAEFMWLVLKIRGFIFRNKM